MLWGQSTTATRQAHYLCTISPMRTRSKRFVSVFEGVPN